MAYSYDRRAALKTIKVTPQDLQAWKTKVHAKGDESRRAFDSLEFVKWLRGHIIRKPHTLGPHGPEIQDIDMLSESLESAAGGVLYGGAPAMDDWMLDGMFEKLEKVLGDSGLETLPAEETIQIQPGFTVTINYEGSNDFEQDRKDALSTIRDFKKKVTDPIVRAGFKKALVGMNVQIGFGRNSQHTPGEYDAGNDVVYLHPSKDPGYTLIHEIGHRVYQNLLPSPNARKWRSGLILFDVGEEISNYAKKDHNEAFAEAFRQVVTRDKLGPNAERLFRGVVDPWK